MLQPKKTNYRKQQKGRNRGLALRGSRVSFGEFGLKAVGRGRMTARQIEGSMPPEGTAASIVISPLVDRVTREALLQPASTRLPTAEVSDGWSRHCFRATDRDE